MRCAQGKPKYTRTHTHTNTNCLSSIYRARGSKLHTTSGDHTFSTILSRIECCEPTTTAWNRTTTMKIYSYAEIGSANCAIILFASTYMNLNINGNPIFLLDWICDMYPLGGATEYSAIAIVAQRAAYRLFHFRFVLRRNIAAEILSRPH